ncbi:initiator RepB protein (plasmid) [Zymomonas mobilis subsp. mobilis NCIMB 11163]|uniref:Replication initiation protein n=2 Tax=Zymomonas mobilis TaxID=542 RepID=C8WG51_ZYMMN|nr:replication initiation protein [Zymomonas mobilis]ACV76438.1 initiator RepB protein [Zymomonas mobilis subsp. mobilis NCIMB 11163]ACY38607.1 replication initiation protein [Zymomonas mobilis subsp. mobilis NCIMB 11163]
MRKTLQIIKDRAGNKDQNLHAGEIIDGHFSDLKNPPSLAALKLYELLIKYAAYNIDKNIWHNISVSEMQKIKGIKNYNSTELTQLLKELRAVVMEYRAKDRTIITGLLDIAAVISNPDTGYLEIQWKFGESFRDLIAKSEYWAIVDYRTTLEMTSRYSLRLYEILALRINLKHKNSDTFTLAELRGKLGVPEGKLKRWSDLRDKAINVAVKEINQRTTFAVTAQPKKMGRSVQAVEFKWERKEIKLPQSIPLKTSKSIVFPLDGSIRYTQWEDIARKNLPKPLPDLDMVAQQFRKWLKNKNISSNSINVLSIFKKFCEKYRIEFNN